MKKSRKQKYSKQKKSKRKQAKTRQQGIPKMLQRNPALREALNCRHPLATCKINKDWQEHGMAIVVVARKAPTGIVYSGFLVDMLGLGLKDVMGDYGVSEEELGEYDFLGAGREADLIDCDYDFASDMVYGGLVWARKWRFVLPKEYKIWMRLLEPKNLDAVDLDRFGKDGEPFLIIPEEDFEDNNEGEVDLEALRGPLFSPEPEPSADILRRIGDIKAVLIEYMWRFEFEDDLDAEARKRFGKKGKPKEQSEWINFQDWFLLECRLSSGDMIVDLFLFQYEEDIHPDVYNMITDWKSVMQGLCEVKERVAYGYRVRNLINEKDYTIYLTNLSEPLFDLQQGDFISCRFVPALDFHVFSGALMVFPLKGDALIKQEMYQTAARMQTQNPALALKDNPEKLEKSREAVRKAYEDFVEYFGKDQVLGTGKEVRQRYRNFFHYQFFEKKDPKTGLSAADRFHKETGKKPNLPKLKFPRKILGSDDVAMLCDPEDYIIFVEEYSYFLKIFAEPDEYLGVPYAGEVVMGYLESDTISDVPFRKVAECYPQNFKKVIDYYGEKEGFEASDIEGLMRQFKPGSYEKIPGIVVIMDQEITDAKLAN